MVWGRLEEGLTQKKHLPVEITVCLYNTHPSALESEVIRVLRRYADQPVDSDWRDWREGSYFTVSRFVSTREIRSDGSNGSIRNDSNHWNESPVIEASVQSSKVFSVCLSLLFKILKGKHSITAVFASSDYFSLVFGIARHDLFTLFPPHLQHLAYVLTLPLVSGSGDGYFQNAKNVSVAERALTEALSGVAGSEEVKSLLCFFPFWLPVLDRRKFLDKYLIDWWCGS